MEILADRGEGNQGAVPIFFPVKTVPFSFGNFTFLEIFTYLFSAIVEDSAERMLVLLGHDLNDVLGLIRV